MNNYLTTVVQRTTMFIASPPNAGPSLEALMLRLATPTVPFATDDHPARGTDPPALRLSSPRLRCCSATQTRRSLARGTASRVGGAWRAAGRIETARPCPPSSEPCLARSHRRTAPPTGVPKVPGRRQPTDVAKHTAKHQGHGERRRRA